MQEIVLANSGVIEISLLFLQKDTPTLTIEASSSSDAHMKFPL